MDTKTRTTTLAISAGSLAWLLPHAASNGSFEQPTTYIGIVVGALAVTTAWVIGRRRAAKS